MMAGLTGALLRNRQAGAPLPSNKDESAALHCRGVLDERLRCQRSFCSVHSTGEAVCLLILMANHLLRVIRCVLVTEAPLRVSSWLHTAPPSNAVALLPAPATAPATPAAVAPGLLLLHRTAWCAPTHCAAAASTATSRPPAAA
jgi:hypothetical protein